MDTNYNLFEATNFQSTCNLKSHDSKLLFVKQKNATLLCEKCKNEAKFPMEVEDIENVRYHVDRRVAVFQNLQQELLASMSGNPNPILDQIDLIIEGARTKINSLIDRLSQKVQSLIQKPVFQTYSEDLEILRQKNLLQSTGNFANFKKMMDLLLINVQKFKDVDDYQIKQEFQQKFGEIQVAISENTLSKLKEVHDAIDLGLNDIQQKLMEDFDHQAIVNGKQGKQGGEKRVLFLGMYSSGKTVSLYMLKLGQVVMTIPTIGFNVETIQTGQNKFTVWDVGGQPQIIPLWKHYYSNTQGLVYFINGSEEDTVLNTELKENFTENIVNNEELRMVPTLIVINKADLDINMTEDKVQEAFELRLLRDQYPQRIFGVLQTTLITTEGSQPLLDWMEYNL